LFTTKRKSLPCFLTFLVCGTLLQSAPVQARFDFKEFCIEWGPKLTVSAIASIVLPAVSVFTMMKVAYYMQSSHKTRHAGWRDVEKQAKPVGPEIELLGDVPKEVTNLLELLQKLPSRSEKKKWLRGLFLSLLSYLNLKELPKWMERRFSFLKKEYESMAEQTWKGLHNGLLIHGPPGNGKSSFLNQILRQYNFPMVELTYESNTGFVGAAANNLNDLVQFLAKKAREDGRGIGILMIDECDSFCKDREKYPQYSELLNHLLSIIEGRDTIRDIKIFVVAVTNLIDIVDKALLDRLHPICFPPPKPQHIKEYLQRELKSRFPQENMTKKFWNKFDKQIYSLRGAKELSYRDVDKICKTLNVAQSAPKYKDDQFDLKMAFDDSFSFEKVRGKTYLLTANELVEFKS
jgi:ATPase family associated with various cellular activities (AAA)